MSEQGSTTDLIAKLGFNTNGTYKLYPAKGDSRSIQIGAFQGSVSFTVWDNNQRGAPIQSIPITREMTELMIKNLNQILTSQPGTTLTMEKQTYVKEGDKGRFIKDIFFKFIKNDKQTYALEITTNKLGSPVLISFKTSGIDIGNGELTDSEKSALSVKAFITYLNKEIPILRVVSLFNPKPRKFGNSGGGQSGGESKYNAPNSTQRYTDSSEDAY